MYNPVVSLTLALVGDGWLTPRSGRLNPGKESQYPVRLNPGKESQYPVHRSAALDG
jgi:hypothetical protein